MRNKIVWKLIACFAAVLLLFTLILGTVFVFMFREHTITINRVAMEEKAVSIADTLSAFESGENAANWPGKGGGGGYGAYLRFLNELAMAEVWILDENLEVLTMGHGHSASADTELPTNTQQIVTQVFQGKITYGEEFSGIIQKPSLTVGAPIRTDDGIIGAVLVHSPASGVEEALQQGMSALAAGVIVALLFAGAAAILLSFIFTSPLRKMKTAAWQLAEGDYTAKTQVEQKDEIGQLAQTIDLLAKHLEQAETERAALDKLKQDFTANVSHELRTPVAVLRGSLEVLQDGTVSTQTEIQEYYTQMLSESHHLERLVNDLLDLSRLQDAQFALDMAEINLCDIVRDTSRAIRMKAQEKDITISSLVPEEACIIWGDYGRIRQMLLILSDNAVKFSSPNSCVELKLEQSESAFSITVTDHGLGINEEDLPYIFERFRKANNSQNASGSGLGLPIAKQIAHRHSAALSVESNDGTTRFSIYFLIKKY